MNWNQISFSYNIGIIHVNIKHLNLINNAHSEEVAALSLLRHTCMHIFCWKNLVMFHALQITIRAILTALIFNKNYISCTGM